MKALDYLYSMKKANEDMGTEPITIYEAIEELEALTTTQQSTQNKFKVGDWGSTPMENYSKFIRPLSQYRVKVMETTAWGMVLVLRRY